MPRRLLVPLILVLGLLVAAIPAGAAGAQDGAIVLRDVSCGIALPGVPPGAVFTENAMIVVTPSGRAVLVCHAQIPEGPPTAVIVEDLFCGLGPGGFTEQSHTVIAPSGRVLLTCHVNPSALQELRSASTLPRLGTRSRR